MKIAILYLSVITVVEFATNFFDPVAGIIAYIIIFVALVVHSSSVVATESPGAKLVLALTLVTLVRMVSLFTPVQMFAPVYWYIIIYPPLGLAAWVAVHRLNFTFREVGFNARRLPLQLAVAVTGLVFGVTEYFILRPAEPLISELTLGQMLLAFIALGLGTGFVEEFIFRGVLQRASMAALGRWGLPYVAFIFTILHLIHNSWLDLIFVFAVAMFFGWVVNKTGSLLGVTLSHGVTNIMLFVIIPLFI